MANEIVYNQCVNWGLRCYETKQANKGLILKCTMSQKKKGNEGEAPEYSKPLFIDVFCGYDDCEIAQDNYEKSFINVDGRFSVSDYTTKNGEKVATMTIFATKVVKYKPQ